MTQCPHCGKPVAQPVGRGRPRVFCSKRCGIQHWTAAHADRVKELQDARNAKAAAKRPKKFRPCCVCGKAFKVGRPGKQKTCSDKCSSALRKQWERDRYASTPYEKKVEAWNRGLAAIKSNPVRLARHRETVKRCKEKQAATLRLNLARPTVQGISKNQLKAEGKLCSKCGKVGPEHGKKMCRPCLEYARARAKMTYEARKAKGLCARCGRDKGDGASSHLCRPCCEDIRGGLNISEVYGTNPKPTAGGKKRRNLHRPIPLGAVDRVAYFGRRCAWCGSPEWQHIDHVFPLARGGKHLPSNFVPACVPCNLSKNATHPAEFARSLGNKGTKWAKMVARMDRVERDSPNRVAS